MLAHSFCTPIFRHGQDSSGGSGGTGAQQVDSSDEEKEEDKEDKGQVKELPSLEGCYEAYLLEIIFSTCNFFLFLEANCGLTSKDGEASDAFWEINYSWFTWCKKCHYYSYVKRQSELRAADCRGCMRKGCQAFRGPSKCRGLWLHLKQVHQFEGNNKM